MGAPFSLLIFNLISICMTGTSPSISRKTRFLSALSFTLLMATLGITYFLEGLGQTLFGSDIYKIDVGMPKDPIFLFEKTFEGGVLVNKEDLYAALIAAALVAVLSLFFQKTATGRALRQLGLDELSLAQSDDDTKSTIVRIVALRAERARLLGFASHAHLQMADSMAMRPERRTFWNSASAAADCSGLTPTCSAAAMAAVKSIGILSP